MDIPPDVHKICDKVIGSLPSRPLWPIEMKEAIAVAVLIERRRCEEICAAEREWGGSIRDAHELIEVGSEPRKISGWNCPSESEN